ncbi:right-handed parallel beta-helix repeat-containing protein [Halovivax gelatinilyticus]|uniref:right-handed parallel beta-helix repeat-containing protein n=1 Tax=Halovivax gelatinilyticus TaxID=2961597 RepID=UPI0020CA8F35|nr:right-handed parallel beta-helix repeat-containing protein [Halovivax gelatinilyticus]
MDETRPTRRSLLRAGGVVAGVLGAFPAASTDRDDATEIHDCAEITEPGRYALSDDVVATTFDCIEIRAADVVVDGWGHELTMDPDARERFHRMTIPSRGDRKFGTGVAVGESARNATIRNLTVSTWDTGVGVDGAAGCSIENVTAVDNVDGIAVSGATDSTVADAAAVANEAEGIVFSDTTDSTVDTCVAARNGRGGIALVDSFENRVDDVDVSRNRGDGVVLEGSDRNALSAVRSIADNTGITLLHADENRLDAVDADRSAFAGVALGYAGANELVDVSVSKTVGDNPIMDDPSAIWLYAAPDNRFEDVTAEDNGRWAIYARDESTDNRFDDVSIDGGEAFSLTVSDEAVDRDETVTSVDPDGESDSSRQSVAGRTVGDDHSTRLLWVESTFSSPASRRW